MRGFYRFYDDGRLIHQKDNIITTEGKKLIAKYLAGLVSGYAGAIAVGAGTTAPTESDTALEYEYARVPITVSNVSGPSSDIFQVSFKGTLPSQLEGVVKESAIISQVFNRYSGTYGDKLLSRFTSNEGWINSSSTNMSMTYQSPTTPTDSAGRIVRIGPEGLKVSTTSASASSIYLDNTIVQGDFSGYSNADQFGLAYSSTFVGAGTAVEVRFYTDANNYFFTNLSLDAYAGTDWSYFIRKFNKTQFSTSGTPTWTNITKVTVVVTAASASTNVVLDALSVFDTDYINPDYVMISRTVTDDLATPIFKTAGRTMDVEYFLEFRL